jgi:hypothetical protein
MALLHPAAKTQYWAQLLLLAAALLKPMVVVPQLVDQVEVLGIMGERLAPKVWQDKAMPGGIIIVELQLLLAGAAEQVLPG